MDCDQIIYIGIFLLIGLMVYRQMTPGYRRRRHHRYPRPFNLEPFDTGFGDSKSVADKLPGVPQDMDGVNTRPRTGSDSLIASGGGDSVGGCPVNQMRQQANQVNWNSDSHHSEEDLEMNESYRTVDYSQMGMNTEDQLNKSCYPQTILSSKDLLPGNIVADVSKFKDAAGDIGEGILEGINYLDAGFHIGVNTVGQSLRNANRQLRSEPTNPQVAVSPWLMSSIGPDLERRSLETNTSCAA